MAMIKRGEIAAPAALPREVLAVPEIGGDVAVVGMSLSLRLAIKALNRRSGGPEGVYPLFPSILAACVLDAEGEPLWDAHEWEAWGAQDSDRSAASVRILNTIFRLSGFDEAQNAKNS